MIISISKFVMLLAMNRCPVFFCAMVSSLASITRLHALHCSLRSGAALRSLVRSLANALTPELMGKRFFVFEINASISYSFNQQCRGLEQHITMAQKKTGHRFIANYMTNFEIDIIISNIIANYEKKSFI